MEILQAQSEDIGQLTQLLQSLFAQEAEFSPDSAKQIRGLKAIIEHPETGIILTARKAGRVIGMVSLLYSVSTALGGRVCILEDMVIDQQYRGEGLGSELLNYAIEYARQQGVLRITLLTDHDNGKAQEFYGQQGFSQSPMIVMRKML